MFILGLLIGGAALVFVIQNISPVTVNFLNWNFDGSLAVVLFLALVAGMLISWLLSIPEMLRLSDLKKHNKVLARELESHKQKLSETQGKLSQAEAPVVLEKTVVVDRQ